MAQLLTVISVALLAIRFSGIQGPVGDHAQMAPEAIVAAEANLRRAAFRQSLADRAQLGDQLVERLMVAHLDKILDQSAHSTPRVLDAYTPASLPCGLPIV